RLRKSKVVLQATLHRDERLASEAKLSVDDLAGVRLAFLVVRDGIDPRIREDRRVEPHRLLRPPELVSGIHQEWSDGWRRPLLDQLPGDAEPVCQPAVALRERVLLQRHQDPTAFDEAVPERLDLLGGLAGD